MGPKINTAWIQKITSFIPRKWAFIVLANISMAIIYGLRVNINLAIVAMVTETKGEAASDCGGAEAAHPVDLPGTKYDWKTNVVGNLLAAYFYGYLVGQIPFAIIAQIYSPKWVMWSVVVVNIIGCFLIPPAAMAHWGVVMLVRIIQGLTAAAAFPAMHCMIAAWSTLAQRSMFSGVIYSGTGIGLVGSTLITGFVTIAVGWENMFYIMGSLCVPWILLWAWLVTDRPPEIEEAGKDTKNEGLEKLKNFPVKAVLKSMPFWAIVVGHFGGDTGLYCLTTEVPNFLKNVLHKNIQENTTWSVIPYVAMSAVSIVAGVVIDILRKKKYIDTTTARRIAASICMIITAAALIGVTFIGCDANMGIVCIIIASGAIGAHTVAYTSNHIDIAPLHAGLLMGMTNTVASISGFVFPTIIGEVTKDNNTLKQWSYGFYSIAVVLMVCYAFYIIFVSGEVQPWNEAGTKTEGEAGKMAPPPPAATPPPRPPPPPPPPGPAGVGRGAGRGRGRT